MLKELYTKEIKTVKDKRWWFTCYHSKKLDKLVYHIHCSDFRKYLYTEENGFVAGGRGIRSIPKTIQKEFLKLIAEETPEN